MQKIDAAVSIIRIRIVFFFVRASVLPHSLLTVVKSAFDNNFAQKTLSWWLMCKVIIMLCTVHANRWL